MIYLNKSDFTLVHELNCFQVMENAQQISSAGDRHALKQPRLYASHEFSTLKGIKSHGQGHSTNSKSLLVSVNS